ncbi:MAG: putative 2-aminoethylphosphonate transport system permease protein PhnV [Candidatus Dichloromethanomonas elyunquensis]|nr:MAG: putative 2-aminoethylphosphonate transport system permease protein PhnV [Candidatus Dichloromethanomonas elyunquensis]
MSRAGFINNLVCGAAVVVAFVVAASPVTLLAFTSFADHGLTWTALSQLLLPNGRRLALFMNSISLGLTSAGACVLFSWFIGSFIWQLTRKFTMFLTYIAIFVWFMALLPPFIHSYTWIAFFSIVNRFLALSGFQGFHFLGMIASWWTGTMAWLPLCLSTVLLGFRCIDPDLIDAAQLIASPLRVLLKVITPLLAPSLLAGGALVFLLSLQEFSIPSLFQVSTYALEIFADYSANNQPVRALLLSVPLMAVGGLTILGALPFFRNVSTTIPRMGRIQKAPFIFPRWFRVLQYGCLLLFAIQVLLPLMVLINTAGSWERVFGSVMNSSSEITFSFWVSLTGSLVAVMLALIIVHHTVNKWRSVLLFLTAISLCIPASLNGIGLIDLYNNSAFQFLYGSDFMPVAASVTRFGPLAWIIIAAHHSRQDASLVEAARFYQVSGWQIWTRIRLRLLMPGIIAAGMTVFLLAIGELGATLLVLPPGRNTLSIKIYNLLHYGASDSVAGLCLFIVLIGWIAGLAAIALLVKRRKMYDN